MLHKDKLHKAVSEGFCITFNFDHRETSEVSLEYEATLWRHVKMFGTQVIYEKGEVVVSCTATHCNTLQHTVTHCNTLHHTATYCNTLHHTIIHYTTLNHAATNCTTLHYIAPRCIPLQHTATRATL